MTAQGLVTSGADAGLVAALRSAAADEKANLEIVAPTAGGTGASDGSTLEGRQLDGAPSVLFDAVAIIATADGAAALAASPAARDFICDAYAHCKFIAYTGGAAALLETAGLRGDAPLDGGFISLDDHKPADFVARCRQLRFWDRLPAPAR